jgi:murein DD-endopeptidase MepM/ murein hydrolase activator NlpD
MLREGFHRIRGNALMALSFIRRSFPVGLGLFLVGALGLSGLPPTQQERAAHAGVAHAGREAAQSWYFLPYPARGQGWQTIVMLTNLGSRELRVNFAAYDKDGEFLGASTTRLAAQATRTLETGEVLPESGTLKVEAKEHLWVGAIFRTRDGTKAEVLPALDDPSRQLDFPALLPGDLSGKTITLLNPDAASASLELIALDQTGAELSRTLLPSLPPMASHTFAVQDLFSADILQQLATVRVLSDKSIVGLQLVDPPDGDLVGLPALTTTSQKWSFPLAAQSEGGKLWTAVGLFNPGEVATSVTIEAFDAAHHSLGVIDSLTLLPGAVHFVLTANQHGRIPEEAAFLKVTSDQAISGYQVVGVVNGKGLSAALGISGEDPTVGGLEMKASTDGSVLSAYPRVRRGEEISSSISLQTIQSQAKASLATAPEAGTGKSSVTTGSTPRWQRGQIMRWPVDGTPRWSNDYASFNRVGNKMYHTGVDIAGVRGATIRAAADGVIRPGYVHGLAPKGGGPYTWWVWNDVDKNQKWDSGEEEGPFIRGSGNNHGLGMTIIIEHKINGETFYSLYGHLDDVTKEIYDKVVVGGQTLTVSQGQPIGLMGFSSYDTRSDENIHVHFELKTHPRLGASRALYWGYTPDLPEPYKYLDPIRLIDPPGVPESLPLPTAFEVRQDVVMRAGPRRNFAVLGWLSPGQKFVGRRILRVSESEEWVEIDIPNERGPARAWVAKRFNDEDYLKEDPSATIVKVIGQVRLRSGPGTDNPPLQVWDNVTFTWLCNENYGCDSVSLECLKECESDDELVRASLRDVFLYPTAYFVSSRTQSGRGSTQPWHEIDIPLIYDKDPAHTSRRDKPVGGEKGRENPVFRRKVIGDLKLGWQVIFWR